MLNLLRRSPKSPNYKRPPLRESNGVHYEYSPNGVHVKAVKKPDTQVKRILTILLYTVLGVTALLLATSVALYANCAKTSGFEIIPKSRGLCHDLYQFLQTGNASLTWNYKETLSESVRAIHRSLTSAVDCFKNFSLLSLKDSVISAFITVRDVIVGLPFWIYDNAEQVVQLLWKLFLELVDFIKAFAVWAFYGALYGVVWAFEWFKTTAANAFSKIPVYWDNLKNTWGK